MEQKNTDVGHSAAEFRDIWRPGLKWEYRSLLYPDSWRSNGCPRPKFNEHYRYRLAEVKEDLIGRPSHYYVTVNGIEVDCLAAVEALGLEKHHYIASAFAYLWRCLHKGTTLMDLKKARFYLDREIGRREKAGES